MTALSDVLDVAVLDEMIAGRYVTRQQHPDAPLDILNYSDQAMFDRMWNEVTETCRGLIVDRRSGAVVARPFRKFFNFGQPEAAGDPGGAIVVADKADGSLGVLYVDPTTGRPAIATRGSFVSDQAVHATAVYRERYEGRWSPRAGWTYLFEIIFPGNRIVVDYEGLDDLVLLGAVDVETGRSFPVEQARGDWPGPVTETFPYASLGEAIAAPDRDNREGFVVHFLDTDQRVKLKQAEYLRLHALLTTCSARVIWQHVAVSACASLIRDPKHWGTWLRLDPQVAASVLTLGPGWKDALLADVPDEFYTWVVTTIADIEAAQAATYQAAVELVDAAVKTAGGDRRRLFELVKDHPWQAALMRHADGAQGPLVLRSWADCEPGHILPFADRANG